MLSIFKVFFPDFIEEKGCTILAFLYNKESFEGWYEEFKGDVRKIEKMSNLYELKDFFHINNSEEDPNKLMELGKVLELIYSINLNKLFSDKSFKIRIFEEYESIFITFYSL